MNAPTPPRSVLETSLAPISRNGHALSSGPPNPSLVMLADPRSPAAEAYRSLAATLQFGAVDHEPPRTIGLTSAAAAEGKSATLANVAVALAEAGQRVIAIDADLRRPGLHSLFGLGQHEGLSNVLLGELAELPLQDTAVPGVRLLASGPTPPNPLEALASRRFEHVLALARAQADFVLVDTAPAAGLADAAVVAPRLGGMLLVVCAGRTKRDLARRAREQLERTGANLLGVVLTEVRGDQALYTY